MSWQTLISAGANLAAPELSLQNRQVQTPKRRLDSQRLPHLPISRVWPRSTSLCMNIPLCMFPAGHTRSITDDASLQIHGQICSTAHL